MSGNAESLDVERLRAVYRMLLDSGDITPMGVRMIEKALVNLPLNGGSGDGPDDPTVHSLPSYTDLMASLDGCSAALARLMGAVRGLFDAAGSTPDSELYDAAVTELGDAHNAAVDWCSSEAGRYTAR